MSKVYDKLVSHKLSSFCVFFPDAQFAYRKGLGCTNALLTISHIWTSAYHISSPSEVLRCSDGVYIVKLDFSAAFDRVSHSGLLFKLKCIGVGGSVLSICREFIDGAMREWTPIVSGVPQGGVLVLFCLSYIPAKCLSWLRTDYVPMQMTPHYWQLFQAVGTSFFFRARFTSFHTHAYLLTFFICCFILFDSCCSHARVFGKTLLHEFFISYSHTEWYLPFSDSATTSVQ